jgi:hypothetical protein
MKKNGIVFWTATIIIALMEAVIPISTWIFAPQYMTVGTKSLDYPDYFAYSLVIAKVLGVVAITYPKTPNTIKEWAYAGLSFTLIFAFISHAYVDKKIGHMVMPLAFLGILAVAYIAKMADFAKPILNHLREIVFATCPDVEENIKWGTPHYSYKGDHLVMMGGFKQHCSFSLYKAELMKDKEIQASVKAGKKFGYMDKIKDIAELPNKEILVAYIKEAMELNANGTAKPKPVKEKSSVEIVAPKDFIASKPRLECKEGI